MEHCYEEMGAYYAEAIRRIGSDERIRKYLGILRRDDSMDILRRALLEGDVDTAFRAAHTIKGSALNLGLSPLTDSSSRLTEALRSKASSETIAPLLEETERAYGKTIACIDKLSSRVEGGQA